VDTENKRLGIGTTNPQQSLDVICNGNPRLRIAELRNTVGCSRFETMKAGTTTSVYVGGIQMTDTAKFQFYTRTDTKNAGDTTNMGQITSEGSETIGMSINNQGRVSIGETTTAAKLTVSTGDGGTGDWYTKGIEVCNNHTNTPHRGIDIVQGLNTNQAAFGWDTGKYGAYLMNRTTSESDTFIDAVYNNGSSSVHRWKVTAGGTMCLSTAVCSPIVCATSCVMTPKVGIGASPGGYALYVLGTMSINGSYLWSTTAYASFTGGFYSGGLSDPGDGNIKATGDITAYASDCRMKCNILTITCATDKIKAIRGVEFEWDKKHIRDCNITFTPAETDETGKTVGFIAQELENVLPTAVREAPVESTLCRKVSWAEKYKTVKTEKIIPLLVEATKEQQCVIERQQRQINKLTCQMELLLRKCA
jgi:hypothetical protein